MKEYKRYPEAISGIDVLLLIVKYTLFGAVAAWLLCFVIPSFRKAALFVLLLVVVQFGFGSFHDSLKEIAGGATLARYVVMLPCLLILFAWLFWTLLRSKKTFTTTTRYFNLLFFILAFSELFFLGRKKWNHADPLLSTLTACASCPKPDIYLCVLDGYGGYQQLLNKLHFDNTPFEEALKARGFYMADSSISNYGATGNSIASLLTMEYVKNSDIEDFHELLNQSTFTSFLKQHGYSIINFSFFKVDGQYPPQEMEYFPLGAKLITRHTLLGRLTRDMGHHLFPAVTSGSQEDRNEARPIVDRDAVTMNQLYMESKTRSTAGPRFVYSHFIMPHPPYLFAPDGSKPPANSSDRDKYIGYVQYSNKKMLAGIDSLLMNAVSPPVILLMSDHGYRNDNDPVLTADRFLNLQSIYLPGGQPNPYYKGMSTVNSLRVFLNQAFRQQIPLLPDSTVF